MWRRAPENMAHGALLAMDLFGRGIDDNVQYADSPLVEYEVASSEWQSFILPAA